MSFWTRILDLQDSATRSNVKSTMAEIWRGPNKFYKSSSSWLPVPVPLVSSITHDSLCVAMSFSGVTFEPSAVDHLVEKVRVVGRGFSGERFAAPLLPKSRGGQKDESIYQQSPGHSVACDVQLELHCLLWYSTSKGH